MTHEVLSLKVKVHARLGDYRCYRQSEMKLNSKVDVENGKIFRQ